MASLRHQRASITFYIITQAIYAFWWLQTDVRHEIHVFELQIETKFEVCYPRIFSSNFVSIRKYLTIIGRGWAKYRDLSVASRHWQITIFCDKSSSIIVLSFDHRSFGQLNVKSLSDCSRNWSTQMCSFNYAWAEYYLQQSTYLQVTWWALG